MLKRISLLLAALGMLLPIAVSALGLGEIRLSSALNEPLRAEIPLISVSGEDAEFLSIRLASRDQYEKAGIEQVPELRQLRFETVTGVDGRPAIKVTTFEAIGEPFLNFLIEVNSPTGRVIREYTVLLDPPVLMRGAPPVSQLPTVSDPAAARPPPVSAPSIVPPSGGEYGPVASGETLWVIAETVRPDPSLTIPQVMLALQQANPDAFIRNNINLLKAGVVLRVPSRDEMAGLAADEARASARAQAAEWDAYRGQAAMSTTPAPRTETAAEGAPAEAPEDARLKLVVPDKQAEVEASTAPEGAGAPAGDGELGELRRQLDLASEEAMARRLQNDELNNQILGLEEQVIALEKLIALNIDEMAALQENLKARDEADESMPVVVEGEQAEGDQTDSALPADAEPDEAVTETAAETGDHSAEVTAQDAATTMPAEGVTHDEEAAKSEGEHTADGQAAHTDGEAAHDDSTKHGQEKAAAVPPPPPPAPEPGLLEDPWILGGVAIIVLALIGVIVAKRRTAGGEPEADGQSQPAAPTAAALVGAESAAEPEAGDAEQVPDDEESGPSFEPGEATGKDVLNEFAPAGLGEEEAEEDPLERADVFLAYGRNDQAEELLRNVLTNDPGRLDVMVKLLEIYGGNQDRASFERQLEDLNETLAGETGPHWERAVELAQGIAPDHRLIAGLGAGPETADMDEEVALDDALGDGELDLDLDFEPVFGDEAAEEPLDITQEFSGDGLADLADEGAMEAAIEAGAESESAVESTSEAEGEEMLDLDFDTEAEPSMPVESGLADIDLEGGSEDAAEPTDVDLTGLDLDLGAEEGEAPAASEALAETSPEAPVELPADDDAALGLDLDLGDEPAVAETQPSAENGGDPNLDEALSGDELDLGESLSGGDLGELDETLSDSDLGDLDETLAGGDMGGFDIGGDMVATKLELAQTYFDMEDFDGAKSIIDEVLAEGNEAQQQQARELLERCPGN